MDSITALGGLVQPIIVRPLDLDTYEVVAEARRFRAAKLAGLPELDARVMELTDEQAIEVQLVENAQGADVHPYEEPAAYKAFACDRKLVMTWSGDGEEATASIRDSRRPPNIPPFVSARRRGLCVA